MTTQTQKIDLHVHTPASTDYKGKRGRKGFLELFNAYQNAKVSTIAITDHNTMNGYREYQRLCEETRQNYKLNSSRDDVGEFLKQLKEEMLCLNSLTVIPGVEICVYPSIHLILLFNECLLLDDITSFLRTDLDLKGAVDTGDPANISPLSPVIALSKARERFAGKFICILPHVDSSKGAWNELSGKARADLFTHSDVLAAQIINPDTKKYLQEVFRDPAYKREKSLRIIQASDHHGGLSAPPAHQHSVVEASSRVGFEALQRILRSSASVRISSEFIDEELKTFLVGKKEISLNFENDLLLPDERQGEFAMSLCASLNTPKTVLTICLHNNSTSASENVNNISALIDKTLESLDPADKFNFSILDFSHGQSRQRFIVDFHQNAHIRLYKDIAYIRDDSEIRPGKAWEVERIVNQNLFMRYGRSKQTSLVRASRRLLMISNSLSAFSVAARMDQFLDKKKSKVFNVEMIKPEYDYEFEPLSKRDNGVPLGDYYLIGPTADLRAGRMRAGSYYRFTIPTYLETSLKSKQCESVVLQSNSVVVFPEGGVNYCDAERPLYAPFPIFAISLRSPGDALDSELPLGLCAYLKSCFLLWYLTTIYDTNDLFALFLGDSHLIPLPSNLDVLRQLASHSRSIISDERSYLKTTSKMGYDDKDDEQRRRETEKHNKACNAQMRHIERDILRSFNAEEEEIREIYRVLNQLHLFDYGINDDLDEFVKTCKEESKNGPSSKK